MKLHEEALGGLSAGIFGTVIGYPLDLLKTRMQTSMSSNTGLVQVAAKIVRQEGFMALYKGIGPPLLSLSVLNTVNFSSYSFLRSPDVFNARRGWDAKNALAGSFVGPIAGLFSTVEHMIKTQMQLDNIGEKRFHSSMQCIKSLVQSHGWRVLYTGHTVNTTREAVFLGSYFFTYEGLREFLMENNILKPQLSIPIAGGISGAFAWFVSFPLDCIKAGIQGKPVGSKQKPNAAEVALSIWNTKGFRGLYSGVTPTLLRAFLVSGSRFSAYELALWMLKGDEKHKKW